MVVYKMDVCKPKSIKDAGKLLQETRQGMRKVGIPALGEGVFIGIYCFMPHISILKMP